MNCDLTITELNFLYGLAGLLCGFIFASILINH